MRTWGRGLENISREEKPRKQKSFIQFVKFLFKKFNMYIIENGKKN